MSFSNCNWNVVPFSLFVWAFFFVFFFFSFAFSQSLLLSCFNINYFLLLCLLFLLVLYTSYFLVAMIILGMYKMWKSSYITVLIVSQIFLKVGDVDETLLIIGLFYLSGISSFKCRLKSCTTLGFFILYIS